ncbi:MAG TPA: cbb3-type cytochrome c oxidase subunit 3 [Steroidobacteraceae bacterium]
MTIGTVRGLITLALLVAFVGLWIWAWSKRRHEDFLAAARLPLDDDEPNSNRDRAP